MGLVTGTKVGKDQTKNPVVCRRSVDIFWDGKMVCKVLESQNISICFFFPFSQLFSQQSNIVVLEKNILNIFLKKNRIGFTQS